MTTAVYYQGGGGVVVVVTAAADLLLSPPGANDTDGDGDGDDPAASGPPLHRSPILRFEAFISVLVPLLFGVVGVLGFVGNLLVILVVVSDRHMRSPTNILIVSLAAADVLFILVCVPFTAYRYAMTDWPFGNVACKLYQYTTYVTAYSSVYSLVLMSVDRYLAVVHPVSSIGYRTERNAVAVLAVLWAVICAVNVPVWIECALIVYPYADEDRSECVNARIYDDLRRGSRRHGRVVYGCFFAFAYFIPLVSICALYGLMLRKLLRGMVPGSARSGRAAGTGTGRPQQQQQQQQQSSNRVRSKRRVTRMVVVVVLIFALCWLPNQTVFLVQYFFSAPLTSAVVLSQVAANCLAYVNSCVNPFLYAFLSENFRKSFGRLLSCHRMIAFHGGRGLVMGAGDFRLNNIRTTEPQTHISGVKNVGGAPSEAG